MDRREKSCTDLKMKARNFIKSLTALKKKFFAIFYPLDLHFFLVSSDLSFVLFGLPLHAQEQVYL
jgi:hypothetical protein